MQTSTWARIRPLAPPRSLRPRPHPPLPGTPRRPGSARQQTEQTDPSQRTTPSRANHGRARLAAAAIPGLGGAVAALAFVPPGPPRGIALTAACLVAAAAVDGAGRTRPPPDHEEDP